MADIIDTSPFAVGDRVQFYLAFFGLSPKWYDNATVVAVNPQTNRADETFDIACNFTVPANSVRPYCERELTVGEICEHILSADEDGNVTSTMPYTIISKHNDNILGILYGLNFTQRGIRAEHLHKVPPELPLWVTFVVAVNPLGMICVVRLL